MLFSVSALCRKLGDLSLTGETGGGGHREGERAQQISETALLISEYMLFRS